VARPADDQRNAHARVPDLAGSWPTASSRCHRP
jgi:hypothetical protein